MLRILLVRLQAEEHILLLTTHHVVCDYWSTRILIRDLFAFYAASTTGQPFASFRTRFPVRGLREVAGDSLAGQRT